MAGEAEVLDERRGGEVGRVGSARELLELFEGSRLSPATRRAYGQALQDFSLWTGAPSVVLTLTGIRRNLDHLVGSAGAEVPQVVRVGRV